MIDQLMENFSKVEEAIKSSYFKIGWKMKSCKVLECFVASGKQDEPGTGTIRNPLPRLKSAVTRTQLQNQICEKTHRRWNVFYFRVKSIDY